MNIANSSVRGTQKGMAVMPASPGKTHTGRVVQCEAATVQTPGQMIAATSDTTSRQATCDYSVAVASTSGSVQETVKNKKSKSFKLDNSPSHMMKFKIQIMGAIETLNRVWEESIENPVARCAAVAKEVNGLKRNFNIPNTEDNRYKLMACKLGSYCMGELDSALKIIKNLANKQRGWGYHKEIVFIGQCLELQSGKFRDKERDRELLKGIYLDVLWFELRYLEFMKDSPWKYTHAYSGSIINDLLQSGGKDANYKFIDPRDEDHIRKEKERLIGIITVNLAKGVTDQNVERLREDAINRPDDVMTRRRYHDFLRGKFLDRENEYQGKKNATTAETLAFFKDALKLRDECISAVKELDLLPRKIEIEIANTVSILLKRSLNHGVRLEEEILDFIDYMIKDRLVNTECKDLFLCCKELEFSAKPAITTDYQANKSTSHEFGKRVAGISNLLLDGCLSPADAADRLKQLLLEPVYRLQIETQMLEERTKRELMEFKKWLCKELFFDIVSKFDMFRAMMDLEKEDLAKVMNDFRSVVAERTSYTFVLTTWDERNRLSKAVCSAWYCDIKELSTAELFRKRDVDCLLDLKRLAPHIPNKELWIVLEKTLTRFFQVVLRDTGEIPDEEIEVLSQWVDGLSRVKCIDEQLKTNHELWKRAHGGAASTRDTVFSDTPSTSAQTFDIDQAAPESVAMKRSQTTTTSVTSDQTVLKAALIQPEAATLIQPEPESEKSSTAKCKPSASTTKVSAAKASKTGVIFPAKWGSTERDTSFTFFGIHGNEEKPLAAVLANTETLTVQASQVASPLWGAADRPSSRTDDRYRLQPAVTTSAEKMTADGKMASHKVDTTVAGCGVQKTQECMAASPGKTHTEKVVHCEAVTGQTPGQMAAATSNTTSRRTTSDGYAMAVPDAETARETAIDGKSSTVETEKHAYHVEEELRKEVEFSLKTMKREKKKHKEEPLLLCLAAVRELDRLLNKFKIDKDPESESYQFVASQLGPHYRHNFYQALEILEAETDTQCGWKHHKSLMSMMKYLDLQADESFKSINGKAVYFCQQLIQSEVNYLEFVKDFPVAGIGNESLDIIEQLLFSLSELPGCCRDFICEEHVEVMEKNKESLMATIQSRTGNGSADEHIKKLAEDMDSSIPDMNHKRLYSELLKIRLSELRKESEEKGCMQERLLVVVKELCELRGICMTRISEFKFILGEITALISGVVKTMLKNSLNNAIRLEDEVMNYIADLMSNNLLSPSCVLFLIRYREFQFTMKARTTVQEDKITEDQCEKKLTEIASLLDKKTHTASKEAAEMLLQLLYWHGDEIKVMSMAETYTDRIKELEKILCKELFESIIEEIKECGKRTKGDFDEYAHEISKYRSTFVELHPYLFVVRNMKQKSEWMKAVNAVCYCDLEELAKKESFNEKDIDSLLALKGVAPEMTNRRVRGVLENVLERFLSNIMEHGYGDIPLEKVVAISQWIDALAYVGSMNNRQKEIDDTRLKELNESLKATWKKDTTPSVTSDYVSGAASIQPESESSAVESEASPAPTVKASEAKASPEKTPATKKVRKRGARKR